MLLTILLVFHILVCVVLIGVVLMQRSEGGALGMGGGPSGFMTARGAGDLLTRITWILFAIFLLLSLGLTLLGARINQSGSVAEKLKIAPVDANTLNRPPAAPAPPPGVPGLPSLPSDSQPNPLTAPSSSGPQFGAPTAPETTPAQKPAPKL